MSPTVCVSLTNQIRTNGLFPYSMSLLTYIHKLNTGHTWKYDNLIKKHICRLNTSLLRWRGSRISLWKRPSCCETLTALSVNKGAGRLHPGATPSGCGVRVFIAPFVKLLDSLDNAGTPFIFHRDGARASSAQKVGASRMHQSCCIRRGRDNKVAEFWAEVSTEGHECRIDFKIISVIWTNGVDTWTSTTAVFVFINYSIRWIRTFPLVISQGIEEKLSSLSLMDQFSGSSSRLFL